VQSPLNDVLPRTLLLTRWAPDARYAGGEDLRKRIGRVPHERVRWAYLARPVRDGALRLPAHAAFPPKALHYRLLGSAWHYYYLHAFQAGRMARKIAKWCAEFRPELLWVASDMEGITVAGRLAALLRVPVHLTAYDAFETCRFFGVPLVFYPYYLRAIKALMRRVSSLDAVSVELIEHIQRRFHPQPFRGTVTFPPSVEQDDLRHLPPATPPEERQEVRRIGFCGATRASNKQWDAFLKLLGRLEWRFEIQVFADPDFFHRAPSPPNVAVQFLPYLPTEMEVIRNLRARRIHACYLGLWKDEKRALFARTSLSSKLSTYAAAGLPVIVDAPEDSVAWRLVGRHGAGILCGPEEEGTLGRLRDLFGQAAVWQAMSVGASALCRAEFNLENNMERFTGLLCAVADGK
jgi:hypothetical protein